MSAPPAKKVTGSSDSTMEYPKIQIAKKPDIEDWEKLYDKPNNINNKETQKRRRGAKHDKQKKKKRKQKQNFDQKCDQYDDVLCDNMSKEFFNFILLIELEG